MSSKKATSASLSSATETPTGEKIAPRCRHFGECGGCARQDAAYEDQLRSKTARVLAALETQGLGVGLAAHPSPDVWFYRNKMEFGFGDVYPPSPSGFPTVLLGQKARGRWYKVVDLKECFLLSPETSGLINRVRDWAEKNSVAPYNNKRRVGLLRNLVVREAKNGSDRMLILVTAPGDIPKESFLEAVAPYPATTVLRGLNAKLSDTAISESLEIWTGPGRIVETLRFPGREFKFRISPQSFFQTNTRATEVLYAVVRSWIKEAAPKTLLDLYCGGGGIGISVADLAGKVIGIESDPRSVEDARENAALNGLENMEFFSSAVEKNLSGPLSRADAAIVDPPRSGLHPQAVEALNNYPVRTLVYVSCNPDSLARDLGLLKEEYEVKAVEVVDLFPHTDHVETAVLLKLRPD